MKQFSISKDIHDTHNHKSVAQQLALHDKLFSLINIISSIFA